MDLKQNNKKSTAQPVLSPHAIKGHVAIGPMVQSLPPYPWILRKLTVYPKDPQLVKMVVFADTTDRSFGRDCPNPSRIFGEQVDRNNFFESHTHHKLPPPKDRGGLSLQSCTDPLSCLEKTRTAASPSAPSFIFIPSHHPMNLCQKKTQIHLPLIEANPV